MKKLVILVLLGILLVLFSQPVLSGCGAAITCTGTVCRLYPFSSTHISPQCRKLTNTNGGYSLFIPNRTNLEFNYFRVFRPSGIVWESC